MVRYDNYIFILCLVVFVALTAFFATLITCIVRLNIILIRGGLADGEIKKQLEKETKKQLFSVHLKKIISITLLVFAITVFFFSLDVKINEKEPVERNVIKVVKSPSMSKKDEFNKYLVENDLNDQIQMFDLIRVFPLPKESELKLYDIVVYEVDGQMVVHRIVDIKEPDGKHSERQFLLRGDANRYSDKFPVLYSQMRGIYTGKKVPYIGSFVVFMNSPAGLLCILLVVVVCIAYPLIEKKLKKEIDLRFTVMQVQAQAEEYQGVFTEVDFFSEAVVTEIGKDEQTSVFKKTHVETLEEKYLRLSEEQKVFYDEIVAYAAAVAGSRQNKNARYEEYKYGDGRLVRVLIKRGIIICEYLIPNDNFKRHVTGNKVKVKTGPIVLTVSDKKSLQVAKDSIDIAKKIIDDEKAYKKEEARLRRRERRKTDGGSENE